MERPEDRGDLSRRQEGSPVEPEIPAPVQIERAQLPADDARASRGREGLSDRQIEDLGPAFITEEGSDDVRAFVGRAFDLRSA